MSRKVERAFTITSQRHDGAVQIAQENRTSPSGCPMVDEMVIWIGNGNSADYREMIIRWRQIDHQPPCPWFSLASDNWAALRPRPRHRAETQILHMLGQLGPRPQPDDIATALKALGFEDQTQREEPPSERPTVSSIVNQIARTVDKPTGLVMELLLETGLVTEEEVHNDRVNRRS